MSVLRGIILCCGRIYSEASAGHGNSSMLSVSQRTNICNDPWGCQVFFHAGAFCRRKAVEERQIKHVCERKEIKFLQLSSNIIVNLTSLQAFLNSNFCFLSLLTGNLIKPVVSLQSSDHCMGHKKSLVSSTHPFLLTTWEWFRKQLQFSRIKTLSYKPLQFLESLSRLDIYLQRRK